MAGLGPAIDVFAASIKQRRRWPAFAGHDDEGQKSELPADQRASEVVSQ
jgi:hypothetical protein